MASKDVASQSIVQGIINALREEFGTEYTYYTDDVLQNFAEPSFFVRQISGSFELIRGRRYMRRGLYQVTYFAADRYKPEREINAVTDRLYPALEYIDLDGHLIRGTDMEHQTEKRELHVSIHYDIFLWRYKDPAPAMQTLMQTQHLKEADNG